MVSKQPVWVDNGKVALVNGYRRVAFTQEGDFCPVATLVLKGFEGAHHSVQQCREGDIVAMYAWKPIRWTFFQIVSGNLVVLTAGALMPYRHLIKAMSSRILSYLTNTKYVPSILPKGIGWDGVVTLESNLSMDCYREFFAGTPVAWLEALLPDIARSHDNHLSIDWFGEDVTALPELLPFTYREQSWRHRQFMHTQYVIWYDDGRIVLHAPPIPAQLHVAAPKPIRVTRHMVRVCKVVRNPYVDQERDGRAYGVLWTLYQ